MVKGMGCLSCPLRDKVKVDPEGDTDCEIVIVGEAPGAEEEKQGRPFVGRSGELLRKVLSVVGWNGRVYITNVVKCRPPGNELTKEMVKCCSVNLEMELMKLKRKPKLILALGKTAKEFFRIPGQITEVRGKVFDTKYGKVLVELHPAYLLRNMWFDRLWRKSPLVDFLKSMMFAKEVVEVGREYKEVKYEVVDSEEKARKVLEEIEGRECAFDFETYRMNPWSLGARVLTCAISVGRDRNWVVDFEKWKGAREFIKRAYEVAKPVFFNAPFDVVVGVKECGWEVREVEDVQVVAYLLSGGEEKYVSLKRLVLDWLDLGDYGIDMKKEEDILKVERDRLWLYNATDAEATIRLYGLLREKLRDELEWSELFGRWRRDLLWAYENVLKKLVFMAVELKVNGIKVDVEYLRELERELVERREEIRRKIGAGVNLNSPQQVMRWLRSRGIEVDSTRKEVLEELVERLQVEELRWLMEYRTIEKLLSTYVVPLRLEHVGEDGLVHASFSVVSTATGRLACNDPNLMNIPTRLGPVVEKAFVSRFREDGVIVKADFSQHELRVACQYSKDRRMREFFESGVDIHTKVAMEVYGLREEELGTEREKELRRVAKGFNFGVIYGRGAKSIAEELGLAEEEGRRMIEDYFRMFSGLKKWLDGVKEFAARYGFVRSMFGRVRWVGKEKEDERWVQKAVNTPVQSAASDIAGLVVYELIKEMKRRGLRAKVVNFIHDAVLVDCPREEVEEVKGIILEKVEGVELPDEKFVRFSVDIGVGRSWGEVIEEK